MELLKKSIAFVCGGASLLLLAGLILSSGYVQDDYGWLNLKARLNNGESWSHLLFTPMAQGTIRVVSERLPFLVFAGWAGLDPFPFRILHLVVVTVNFLCWYRLLQEMGSARHISFLGLACWYWNPSLVKAHLWSSALNQSFQALMIGVCLLSSRWPLMFLTLYVVSLWVHELCVFIPIYLLLARGRIALTRLWWSLSIAIGATFVLVSRVFAHSFAGHTYSISVHPHAFTENAISYAKLAFPGWSALVSLGLIVCLFFRVKAVEHFRSRWLGLALLAPLLVYLALPNIQNGYYLFVPLAGGMVLLVKLANRIEKQGGYFSLLGVTCLIFVLRSELAISAPSHLEFSYKSKVMSNAVAEVANIAVQNSDKIVIVFGLSHQQYHLGWSDDPFRAQGLSRVFLAPGSFELLRDPFEPIFFYSKFIDGEELAKALDSNRYFKLVITGDKVRPVSDLELSLMKSNRVEPLFRSLHFRTLEVDQGFAGVGEREGELRWVDKYFRVPLSVSSGQKYDLGISLFSDSAPCDLSLAANGSRIASFSLRPSWQRLERREVTVATSAEQIEGTLTGSCRAAIHSLVLVPLAK